MLIRTFFNALPGPKAFRVLVIAVIVVAVLIALHFIYTWMGDRFLDTGGGVG